MLTAVLNRPNALQIMPSLFFKHQCSLKILCMESTFTHVLPGAPDLPAEFFEPLCEALPPMDTLSDVYVVPKVSSSPRLEEKTRSREGNFSIHSTLDTGKQLNLI